MGKNQHVVPHKYGWAVKGEGNSKPSHVRPTQADAIVSARGIARNQHSEVVIHRADGRIRDKDSYAKDPCPPKDKKHSGRINKSNQITLPGEIVNKLGLKIGDQVVYKIIKGHLLIKPLNEEDSKAEEYFYSEEWQDGERSADQDISKGKLTGPFDDIKDLLHSLQS